MLCVEITLCKYLVVLFNASVLLQNNYYLGWLDEEIEQRTIMFRYIVFSLIEVISCLLIHWWWLSSSDSLIICIERRKLNNWMSFRFFWHQMDCVSSFKSEKNVYLVECFFGTYFNTKLKERKLPFANIVLLHC